jgi:hypothetical protein
MAEDETSISNCSQACKPAAEQAKEDKSALIAIVARVIGWAKRFVGLKKDFRPFELPWSYT